MAARFDMTCKLKVDLKAQIVDATKNDSSYKIILKQLIIECLIKLMEKKVSLRCLRKDEKLVESILGDAISEFSKLIKDECS
mmetsp:Transcript_125002/g.186698  ORF Transcript_125002/g.186698 Transcript_125002/m.186698 type:complete len:82 (+) Transcript_125002:322-567(+)